MWLLENINIKLFGKFTHSFPEQAGPNSNLKPIFIYLDYCLLACRYNTEYLVISLKAVIKNHSCLRVICTFSDGTAQVDKPLVFDCGVQAHLTNPRLLSGQNTHLWSVPVQLEGV